MKKISGGRGSITIEATIIIPVSMVFILVILNFVKVATVYLAVDHEVAEITKQIAAYSYFLKYTKTDVRPFEGAVRSNDGVAVMSECVFGGDTFREYLPDIALEFQKVAKEEGFIRINNAFRTVIEKRLSGKRVPGGIRLSYFKVREVKMPYFGRSSVNNVELDGEDVAIVVEYGIELPFPFLPLKEIRLSNTAVERAWMDD